MGYSSGLDALEEFKEIVRRNKEESAREGCEARLAVGWARQWVFIRFFLFINKH